jgi:hypothetical protein
MNKNNTFVTDAIFYETNARVEVLLKIFPRHIENVDNFVFDVGWETGV